MRTGRVMASNEAGEPTVIPRIYPITVDYDLSLEQMMAAGRYDWQDKGIRREGFPFNRAGRVESILEIPGFAREMKSHEIVAVLKEGGLQPATLPELLAFGAAYPEMQLVFPIVALGSVWEERPGVVKVPYLSSSPGGKRYCLLWEYQSWFGLFHFAAARHAEGRPGGTS